MGNQIELKLVQFRKQIGRNGKCPCCSGKKFKKCCWNKPKITLILEGEKNEKI